MNKKLITLTALTVLLLFPFVSLAAVEINLIAIINRLLDLVVWPIFFGLSVIMFIYAGILFVIAKGDPSRITSAKQAVIWATVGIVIALVGFSAEGIIRAILGIPAG